MTQQNTFRTIPLAGNALQIILMALCIISCNAPNKNAVPMPLDSIQASVDTSILTSKDRNNSKTDSEYREQLHEILKSMNNNLSSINLTSNPENDFARLMTNNIFAGIQICLLQQHKGTKGSIKKIAKEKQEYLQKKEAYFDNYQFNSTEPYTPSFKKQASRIKHLIIPSESDADKIFATIISEYDESTIDLAKDYLKHGNNITMRKVAKEIIQSFSNEIAVLKKI